MVGTERSLSGPRHRRTRYAVRGQASFLRRLRAIHEGVASGRPEPAIELILHEAGRLVCAPMPAGLYRAASDGSFSLAPCCSSGSPATLPDWQVQALRQSLAHGRRGVCSAAPGASLVLLPVQVGSDLRAILRVPLPRPHLTAVQRDSLRLLAGLLATALRQERLRPLRPLAADDEALQRVVAGVAHELNNPLAIISGYAQVLLAAATSELRPDLERIDRAARRAAQVVRDLLAFAREQPIALTHIPVDGLVHDALVAEEAALTQSGIGVSVRIDDGLPPICGDRLQLAQVLVHLIAQARRTIVGHPGASRLTIRAWGNERVHLSISDDGPGIAPELIERVFEPFMVSHNGGLTLSVCRSVVRAHGGRIWASNNPAGGSTFHIELPSGEQRSAA